MLEFTREQVNELANGRRDVVRLSSDLQTLLVARQYRNDKTKKHALHGLARRVGTLARCVDSVFKLLPPDNTQVPEREAVYDATINIQAFVFNVFGCCDNVAWMWVLEKDVRNAKGKPLDKKQVGIGADFKEFKKSCSQEFRDYLATREEWLVHLKNFRDALAHQIPLYIPLYTIEPAHEDAYRKLVEDGRTAHFQGNLACRAELLNQQRSLERFTPIMLHSQGDSRPVVFHAQLVADFRTVDEMSRRMLEELDRS